MPYLPKPSRPPAASRRSTNSREDKRFLDSGRWEATRQMQLQKVPYCEACFQNQVLTDCVKGGHIDHIVRRAAGGAELDERNIQTLCKMHHDRKSALERHGLQVKSEGPEGCRVPGPREKERILKLIG